MGDTDPPPLDEIPEDGDLPSYWAEDTTITVRRATKQRLDAHRDDRPWDVYLEQLRREHADPLTLNGVLEIADHVSDEVDASVDADELALAVCDYLMGEYQLADRVADEVETRFRDV